MYVVRIKNIADGPDGNEYLKKLIHLQRHFFIFFFISWSFGSIYIKGNAFIYLPLLILSKKHT